MGGLRATDFDYYGPQVDRGGRHPERNSAFFMPAVRVRLIANLPTFHVMFLAGARLMIGRFIRSVSALKA